MVLFSMIVKTIVKIPNDASVSKCISYIRKFDVARSVDNEI